MKNLFAVIIFSSIAFSSVALAQECNQVIEGNDLLQFNMNEIRVSSTCSEVTITLIHVGKLPATIMGHNWVLTESQNYMDVATASQISGPPNYLPSGDNRIIAATDLIGGGEETSVTFDISSLDPAGDYTYFCTFPGHFVLMKGKFVII